MISDERINEILKLLNKNGKVLVKNLSKRFNVTEDLIRKDLKKLEKNEEIRRIYGGAVLRRDNFLNLGLMYRKTQNPELKLVIAKKAFNIIEENDNIFLDISSTNLILASLIAKWNKKVTVVTNVPDIIKILDDCEHVDIIGIGGFYNKKANGFIGSLAVEYIKKFRVDKAFLGCCGLNLINNSIMTIYTDDGITKQKIINISKHCYILTENKKFIKEGLYKFAGFEEIEGIITETKPDAYIEELLAEKQITLL